MSICRCQEFQAVGYRFRPTDEELVNHYLKYKSLGYDSQVNLIPEVDLCQWEPWELLKFSRTANSGDKEWYFFCRRDQKYPNSRRMKRATPTGFWKPTGNERTVKSRGTQIGTKKTLVFYKGRAPNAIRTSWVMHEYCAIDNLFPSPAPPQVYIVYRMKKKTDENTDSSANDEVEPMITTEAGDSLWAVGANLNGQSIDTTMGDATSFEELSLEVDPQLEAYIRMINDPTHRPLADIFPSTSQPDIRHDEDTLSRYPNGFFDEHEGNNEDEFDEFLDTLIVDEDGYVSNGFLPVESNVPNAYMRSNQPQYQVRCLNFESRGIAPSKIHVQRKISDNNVYQRKGRESSSNIEKLKENTTFVIQQRDARKWGTATNLPPKKSRADNGPKFQAAADSKPTDNSRKIQSTVGKSKGCSIAPNTPLFNHRFDYVFNLIVGIYLFIFFTRIAAEEFKYKVSAFFN